MRILYQIIGFNKGTELPNVWITPFFRFFNPILRLINLYALNK